MLVDEEFFVGPKASFEFRNAILEFDRVPPNERHLTPQRDKTFMTKTTFQPDTIGFNVEGQSVGEGGTKDYLRDGEVMAMELQDDDKTLNHVCQFNVRLGNDP